MELHVLVEFKKEKGKKNKIKIKIKLGLCLVQMYYFLKSDFQEVT